MHDFMQVVDILTCTNNKRNTITRNGWSIFRMSVSLVLTWKCCILENIDQHVLIDWHYQSIFTLRDLSLQSDFVFDIDIFPIKMKGDGLKPTYFTFLAASLTLFTNCLYLWLVCWLCERWFLLFGRWRYQEGHVWILYSWFNPDILLYLSELSKSLDFHRLLLWHICAYCIVVWFKQYFYCCLV
jgi:hypothetical protein